MAQRSVAKTLQNHNFPGLNLHSFVSEPEKGKSRRNLPISTLRRSNSLQIPLRQRSIRLPAACRRELHSSQIMLKGYLCLIILVSLSAGCGGGNGSSQSVTQTPTPTAPPPTPPSATIHLTVNALQDRHLISPYVYGVNFPPDTNYIQDTGTTLVRWGGNATSRYNWQNFDTNAANDFYFVNRAMGSPPLYQDSLQFLSNVASAGGDPIMTMPMLPWVAKDSASASFSVAKYGAQCKLNPFNSDQGNGVKTDCTTNITGNDPTDADVPLLDQPGNGDPASSVYRNQWAAALSAKFGLAPHFYDMDNEIDIWGGTHRDVHPAPSGYGEMRDTFLKEARLLKAWDAGAIRFGPVSCCWYFYFNGADSTDKARHAGIDFLPWWLNEVLWSDAIAGSRSLDVFDFHAYPDAPDTRNFTLAQKQALALRILRDYWDPTYASESSVINQQFVTQLQPNRTIPFRIPRLRALVNSIYPGTPISVTEWNVALAGETDFSTALADAEAWGILGRERVYASSRWTAAAVSAPAYQALKLFRNYDGQHHGFGSMSVAATHDADPNLFSSFAALDPAGTTMTLLLINKNLQAPVTVQTSLNGFTPSQVTTYSLSSSNPTSIVAGSAQPWTNSQSVAALSASLLVITGTTSQPAAEWNLNPDTTMCPAGGTVVLQPAILSGTGKVTLTGQQSDSGITVSLTQSSLTSAQNGTVTVACGNSPGFYHYSVSGIDSSSVSQTQGGWIVVGNQAAILTKTGDGQSGSHGGTLTLSATLVPATSGGMAQGATLFFTTDSGSLSSRMVVTDSSGTATVTLTLPANAGQVRVLAEGPFALGHPTASFVLTAN